MTDTAESSNGATVRCAPDESGATLRFGGRLDARHAGAVWAKSMRFMRANGAKRLVIDAEDVTYCDGTGIGLLVDLRRGVLRRNGTFELRNFPERYRQLLDLFRAQDFAELGKRSQRRTGFVIDLGRATVGFGQDLLTLIAYVGEILAALVFVLFHPKTLRWRDCLGAMQAAGMNALPVVGLIGLLIGLVIGFQSAVQLRQFGGDVFLAPLIGKSMLRELGPLMTAVVLTARSGSAFAAEIGTMKVNEEINALRTMGVDPVRFLITPRAIATVLMTPLLTMFANFAGIVGGGFVAVTTLSLPVQAYTNGLVDWLTMQDLVGGLAKATVFGALIAGVGCIRGLQTGSGAAAVGQAATRAVVSGIVLIVVTDSVFSVLYYHLDI